MAFPSVRSIRAPATSTTGTSHTVQLPATVSAGDYLFVVFSSDGAITVTWDNSSAGTWTLLSSAQFTSTGACTQVIYYKVADGTEDGVNLSIGTSVSESASYITAAIQDADGIAAGTATNNSNTNTTTPDPPSLTHGWGAVDVMFWAIVTYDNGVDTTTSSYPSSYTDNQNTAGTGTGAAKTAAASRNLNAASDDPGTFTISNSRPTIAQTIAFKPLATATLTDVDTDETITTGQTGIAYTGTGLTDADGLVVTFASREAAATAFVATNATSGTFTAPSLSAVLTAGVKFGSVTFQIEDGGVSLATLAGTLNPESGWVVHNVTDTSQATDPGCIYFGQSPPIANGDQILFESNGSNVTIDSQGFVTLDGVTSFSYYIWDDTDDTWGSVGLFSGAGGAANNIWQYLYEAGTSGGIMRRMKNFLNGLGYTGNTNKMLFNWLRANGYTRTLTGMLTKFERDNTNRYG